MNAPEKLLIYGEKIDDPGIQAPANVQHEGTYLIGGAMRGEAHTLELDLHKDNLIEFSFEDGSTWLCGPEDLERLFPEINIRERSTAGAPATLPLSIQSDRQQRNLAQSIALRLLRVFTKKALDTAVHTLAEKFEDKALGDLQGLLTLRQNFSFEQSRIAGGDKPYLLFIHGTGSSTAGSFGRLAEDSGLWQDLYDSYNGRVLALQHRTLTQSPLGNVLTLAEALPASITLDLVTHSRGGIVGDIFNRFCCNPEGFSDSEMTYLRRHDRRQDIDTIEQIRQTLRKKKITIRRFVRVACPASGTTLASSRLDFLLNMLLNLLGFIPGAAANPACIALKELLSHAVSTKDDAAVLPGLEPQNPESPFIGMLNNELAETEIDTPLMVIAGNSNGMGSVGRGLLVIASRLFYRGKNDFIVDTASMANGARRATQKVQYFLDEGSDVSHFNYFTNATTRKALLTALQHTGNELVPGFQWQQQRPASEEIRNAVIKSLQYGGEFRNRITGRRPIAVLLPGIMGSNLSVDGDTVWINYARFLTGGLSRLEYDEQSAHDIRAVSLIKTSYGKLADHLENAGYDVVTFPFDWRLPMTQCAAALNALLSDLPRYRQPVKLIGHSMGGVLLRDFIIHYPDTWKALNAGAGFRLLFLGSPLHGSFRIPYVLFGLDDIIRTLNSIDLKHSKKDLVGIFRNLPGLLCLLPLTKDSFNDFADVRTWEQMRDRSGDLSWPIPDRKVLQAFGIYRDKILKDMNSIDFSNAVYIAGQNRAGKFTPSGYRFNNEGRLEFLVTRAGDESVTWKHNIPDAISHAGNVYYSSVTHGELANDKSLFRPITDVLANGTTSLLRKTPPELRAGEEEMVARPSFVFDRSPGSVEKNLMGLVTEESYEQGILPLSVSISNGDLKFASFPVLTGHFLHDGIFSAEKVINRYLDGEISKRMQLGLYPGEIGTCEILIAEQDEIPRFKGAIIAGLGKQGNLSMFLLSQTVEQAVSKYLTGFNNKKVALPEAISGKGRNLGISSLIIGCGYGGLTIENSIRAVITGVQNANRKIRQTYPDTTSLVNEIEFVELLRDRALGCIQALKKIGEDDDKSLQIVWKSKGIKRLLGWQQRLPTDNTSDWWTRITVKQLEDTKADGKPSVQKGLRYNISTDAAREEERFIRTGKATIMPLLDQMSELNQWNNDLAKTIFELLIPYDFKDQLKRQNNINWLVDKHTAAYPWELLHDSESNALPLSVNAGMIRQLATQEYRLNIKYAAGNTALVVGDPDLTGTPYKQLRGAADEAAQVHAMFTRQGIETGSELLARASAAQILLGLFSKNYKILHLAGHGIFNADPDEPSGMVIGKDAYITTAEISQMSTVPELAFINCCYLGKTDGGAEATMQQRYRLAANIGTELIEIGVKAVVVAGWAVDDDAALAFTECFYQHMFRGYTFGEAIRKARRDVYDRFGHRTNTWGAYQCYGDPFYSLRAAEQNPEQQYRFIVPEEAEIELSRILTQIDIGEIHTGRILEKIRNISGAADQARIRNSEINTLEMMLYAALNQYALAIAAYEKPTVSGKADYSIRTMEKYCYVRAKYVVQQYRQNPAARPSANADIDLVLEDLIALKRFDNSAEWYNLMGSTCKRKAQVTRGPARIKALKDAAAAYAEACRKSPPGELHYPLTNWFAVLNILIRSGHDQWGRKGSSGLSRNAVLQQLDKEIALHLSGNSAAEDMSYWQLVALANLHCCRLQLDPVQSRLDEVFRAYRNVWCYAGHNGNRQTEIEQLDFLEEMLLQPEVGTTSPRSAAARLPAMILQLKNSLLALKPIQ